MVTWAADFEPPTRAEASAAAGTFPAGRVRAEAENVRPRRAGCGRPESVAEAEIARATARTIPPEDRSWRAAAPFGGSKRGWPPGPVPFPTDEADWLAADSEEGQSFDEYPTPARVMLLSPINQ